MRKLTVILLGLISIAAVACGGGLSDDEGPAAIPTADPTAEAAIAAAAAPTVAAAETVPAAQAVPASTPTTQESMPASQPPATPAEQQASVEPGVDRPVGGVFRRLWSDPPTLDPHLTTDTTSAGIIVEIYSGLVAINADLQLVPDIAESWDISPDGLVYTFRLRSDVKFHDGKPVTANDFKWSLERAANPDTASPVADTYINDIVGMQEVFDGLTNDVSGIKVIDDRTLQLTIDAPKAYFLAKLTYPTAYVLDRENVEAGGRTWTDTPNGTGPFKLKDYRIGERIVLERNELYYRQPAYIDTILMNLAGGQSMAMYENDEIDITGVGLFDLDRVLDPNSELNADLIVAPPEFTISYIGFNTTMPPFNDVKFRQALNHAVDKELIATEVLSDLVVPAYGILPPGFPAYSAAIEGLRFDAQLASRLLSESSYSTLSDADKRIVITVPGTGGTIGLDLEVVIEMWRQRLGVEVEIQQVEWATYLEDLNRNAFQAFAGLGWSADYPDPQDFLDILFHSDSSINHGAYSNPAVDAILEEARLEQDVLKRVELYRRAEVMIVDDAAWVPLWYQGERHVLVKPHVEGYRLTPMIIPKLKQIYIEG